MTDLFNQRHLDYPNTGKRWTPEDEEKLEYLFKEGESIELLMEKFGRTEAGIINRLEKLDLM